MKPVSFSSFAMQAALFLMLVAIAAQVAAESHDETVTDAGRAETQPPAKAWLELQSSGKAASAQAQPLPGPVMDQVQERYLKSFAHPVPPYFEHVQPIDN